MSTEIQPVEVKPQEIAERQAELRNLGIAEYRAGTSDKMLTEEETIASEVRASWSTTYVAVRDPYSKGKGLVFRIFPVDLKNPTIPMGYTGCPLFKFEAIGEDPRKVALDKILGILAKQGKVYTGRCLRGSDEHIQVIKAE